MFGGVGTDVSTFADHMKDRQDRTEMFSSVMAALERAIPLAMQVPELMPLIRTLLSAVTSSFKLGHGVDSSLEEAFDSLQRVMEEGPQQEGEIPPEEQPPTPEEQQMVLDQRKQQWEVEKTQMMAQMKQLQAQLDTMERQETLRFDIQKAAALSQIKVREELQRLQSQTHPTCLLYTSPSPRDS